MTAIDGPGAGAAPTGVRIITTIAGTGEARSDGDGGPASRAGLDQPRALAADAAGGVYVAEWKGHRVRRIAPDGTITTVAGTGKPGFGGDGGPAVEALVHEPGGLVVDDEGGLYLADYWNHRIRRISPDGVITTVAGTGFAGHGGDGGPALLARFAEPRGLALDGAGNLYVAEWKGHRVRRIAPDGTITTVAGTGEPGFGGDGVEATASALRNPIDVAVGGDGVLYIADCWTHRVRAVSPDGVITTVAGTGLPGYDGDGGPAARTRLDQPRGVDLDAAGRLYIADSLNQRVRVVTPDGLIATVAGGSAPEHDEDGGRALGAELYFPRAVAVADDDLLVAECDSHRVRRIFTVAGLSDAARTGGGTREASVEPVTPATVQRNHEFALGARIGTAAATEGLTVELALPEGLVGAVDGTRGPLRRTYPGAEAGPAGATADGVFRVRAPETTPPGRYDATLTVLRGTGPAAHRTELTLSVVVAAPLPVSDEQALTVLQENVPQAAPGAAAVLDVAYLAPAGRPVNPGRIAQRFTAPTGFAFDGRPLFRYPHALGGTVAKRVGYRMEDSGRTLVVWANPHVNTVAADSGRLVCTLPLRALPNAAPGRYEDGSAEVGDLAPVPLVATVVTAGAH
ncbi:NHL repeat-containing protein [Streptomyces sp. NPDC053079]|uniref:NHL repeat-containing protein n=1 Tax=Streptomyces sp. NPDC053079 TaxID=3365697 RepID=UPI0037D29A16